ncbi:MAG: dTDP-4-dehydrorhamnose reductase [Paludibacteraceae bacterium]|nr:dTDP-4-dehydrorhamnose reductase [Paludibacteraceae bacterium]
MTILITGANGQLGNEMRIVSRNSSDKYIFTDVNQIEGFETTYLDITDLDAIRNMVKKHNVNAIVNCAAWTNVDGAEDPEKYALVEKLNATAPENLAKAMKEVGGLLIQISTDYVFGKEPYNTPCKEDQTGTPTGVYGATKLKGEQNIINVSRNSQLTAHSSELSYIIIRTAWLYSEFGKNFCKTMLNLTATKPQLKVVFDQCGTPTYAGDLASAIMSIIEDYNSQPAAHYSKSGIYHYSNEGVCSWFDFTKMIQQIAVELGYYEGSQLTTHCDIQPCHSSEFPSPVTRPSYSVLDKTKIKETFGIKVPYWTDSLRKCINNIKKQGS